MKRGESGLSLVVGVNKPSGMSSHDVVNACRRIFNERRVGHMGTLDPLATGVLPVAVGAATRLNAYLSEHDKTYRVTMAFGAETDTDDCEGAVTYTAPVPDDLLNGSFASAYVEGLCGEHLQTPPQYSAIKVGGKKAYEQARKGVEVELEPRLITVQHAQLVERRFDEEAGTVVWVVDLSVSKGTYIRAIVRDMGRELGCLAHVHALERQRVGSLESHICVSLQELEAMGPHAALDPLRLLDVRFAFCDEAAHMVENGNKLASEFVALNQFVDDEAIPLCACCSTSTEPSEVAPVNGELVGIVIQNKLKALYSYDAAADCYRASCVFATPIVRAWH